MPSKKRIATIVKATRKYDVSQAFRFLTKSDRDSKQIITDTVWHTVNKDERRIIYRPPEGISAVEE